MQHRIGANVKRERRKQQMGRETLAVRAGLSFSTVARIERGDNWPEASTLNALASALGVTPESLWQTDPDGEVA